MSKASHLHALQAAGFAVPAFVVLPSDLYESFLATTAPPATWRALRAASLPPPLAQKIIQAARQLPNPYGALAVRSSASGEDSVRYSFAGQFDSFLDVRGDDGLLAAVQACWASAFGDRVLAYRAQHGLPSRPIEMEVILQAMVPAEKSGVAFTADPATRDPRWLVISATAGLGDKLLQGQEEGETVRVNRDTGEIAGERGVLNDSEITALAATARKIEALFGRPQDVEFAVAGGQVFILQARPITVPIFGQPALWDNANITESYSGVTTPLTFTVIRGAYAQVYRQFLALMGVNQVDEGILRNLLGFYQGRVYYQLLNWYRALALLPAFRQNRRFMEQMMGVKQPSGERLGRASVAGEALALLPWLGRMLILHVTSQRRVQEFSDHFTAVLAEYQAQDFAAMSAHQLRAAYLDLETRLLGNWQAPILTDFFAMVFFGVLRGLSERWLERGGSLHNDLLAGDGALESLEPLRQVQTLARQVRADPRLRDLFARPDPAETLAALRSQSEWSTFQAAFDDYLRRYGDRWFNELKLEEPNLRDEPTRLVGLIAATAEHNPETTGQPAVRAKAEARLSDLKRWQRPVFRWVLKHARRHMRNRENMRFARTRLFGLLRVFFNALGRQWAEAGVLERPTDIYYLTVNEIWEFVEGTATTLNLRGLVDLRRAEYSDHKAVPLPDRFETLGLPYLDTPRDLLAAEPAVDGGLRGVGCCSGRVTGRARVMHEITGIVDLAGDILVAERTDPGWVFLFPSALGILIERGSPLSHSVIIARELGKPIIVNIRGLTARVRTGDVVEMDGALGVAWVRK